MQFGLSRRRLLKSATALGASAVLPSFAVAAAQSPLYIPPLLDVGRGRPVLLSMGSSKRFFDDEKKVETWGFNGLYLGPTVRCKQGDFVRLNYHNQLPQAISISLQGLQVNGELYGGVGRQFQAAASWAPIVPITQPAATCWYHADTLAHSAYQVYRGLAGMWLIDDAESLKARLPNKYGINDIPLILQDLSLNSQGEQLFNLNQQQFLGNRLFVNGGEAPYLNVARGWVRLRILNASVSRSYQLSLDDGRSMLILAGSLGFLPQLREVRSIFVPPGERAEILVDLNEGGAVSLISGEKRGFLDKFSMWFADDDELSDNTVLTLRPDGLVSVFNQQPDFQRAEQLSLQVEVARQREFFIDVDNALINQQKFDPRRVDVNAKLGSYERWNLTATAPIGFSVQGAKFMLESFNGLPVDVSQLSWRDTVWVNGNLSILVKFDHTSSNTYPFTFGSSDLMLADKGCMGMLVVQ
ncbi:cell division protein FtsQ [Chelonobacter oris]|uniref:Cell division protein FtsP n=1 Tax=Chelonobacter oris TaxID=505317 RepID=A0A0A3AKN0_9PAST|nr:multicopper oxidase domain-containing protein [Chelonobacter oris]KGQ69953.1 cell division protein FtsQ [Chelonobacter oris]MDH3000638.1 cell division protein FtsQ [Chelonobacter oris]